MEKNIKYYAEKSELFLLPVWQSLEAEPSANLSDSVLTSAAVEQLELQELQNYGNLHSKITPFL